MPLRFDKGDIDAFIKENGPPIYLNQFDVTGDVYYAIMVLNDLQLWEWLLYTNRLVHRQVREMLGHHLSMYLFVLRYLRNMAKQDRSEKKVDSDKYVYTSAVV